MSLNKIFEKASSIGGHLLSATCVPWTWMGGAGGWGPEGGGAGGRSESPECGSGGGAGAWILSTLDRNLCTDGDVPNRPVRCID